MTIKKLSYNLKNLKSGFPNESFLERNKKTIERLANIQVMLYLINTYTNLYINQRYSGYFETIEIDINDEKEINKPLLNLIIDLKPGLKYTSVKEAEKKVVRIMKSIYREITNIQKLVSSFEHLIAEEEPDKKVA